MVRCARCSWRALLKAFTGADLVPADIAAQTGFALAVAGGAGLVVAVGRGVHFASLGTVDRKVITGIVISWVVTLPAGAIFGALLFWMLD